MLSLKYSFIFTNPDTHPLALALHQDESLPLFQFRSLP